MQNTLTIKSFQNIFLKSLIIFLGCLLVLDACTTSKKIDEGNGITLNRWHWNISFHELGRDYTILYYKGTKICPNIDFYILSSDKKYILYSHEVEYNKSRLEIYDTEKKSKKIFKHEMLYFSEPSKVDWYDNKIELGKKIILYLNEEIMESKKIYRDTFYFDYLLFQIDQLYEKTDSFGQERIKELCKSYLGKRLTEQELMGKGISPGDWQKLGDSMYSVIDVLRDKYKDRLVFQVFERSFFEHFKIEQGKVKFDWPEEKPRKRRRPDDIDINPQDYIKNPQKVKD